MKKFGKLLTVILAMALFLFTPGIAVVSNGAWKMVSTAATQYDAPTQALTPFTEETVSYNLGDWRSPSNNYIAAQQITASNNAKFHETYPDKTLTDADMGDHTPYVIVTETRNMPARANYTSNDITLSANSYYAISVEYYVVEQANNTTGATALGTFYLDDDHAITLLPQKKWDTATFYLCTDRLATTTITPALYLGSRDTDALGAIYFDHFTVTAMNASRFQAALEQRNPSTTNYWNLTQDYNYKLMQDFDNVDFTARGESYNNIPTATVPKTLNFEDHNKFYPQNGADGNVMLLSANQSDAELKLNDYTFQPRPYEVYMFQFYSIATAAENFKFYLMIGNTAQEITSLTNYPHHNGWQLNTVFYIAGRNIDQAYNLSFNLGNGEATTGWVCLDDFKIYRVNGSYATDNASGLGVHDVNNTNESTTELSIANGYFDLGTTADNLKDAGSSYPYPLVAKDWTTNVTSNGIVNLHPSLWDERFGDTPSKIPDYDDNNNVYMMHNSTRTTNVVTSPALTTTTGATTYVSFDACGYTAAEVSAYIFTAETDDNNNFTNQIILGEKVAINHNAWHHYEIAIQEDTYATSRNYYLCFEMKGIGYAYLDNARTDSEALQFATTATTSTNIDLTNALAIEGLWQATDSTAFYRHATSDGLTLENFDGRKTVVKNTFGYNFTADKYYEIVVRAHGNNAYLGLSDYTGLLQVTTDTVDADALYDYKLYLHHSDTVTTTNLQITLGDVSTDADTPKIADGNVFLDHITINEITADEYDHAAANAGNDARMQVLSVSDNNDDNNTTDDDDDTEDNNFFGENWWYLVPTLITALAIFLAIATFLFRKIKFDKHITKKNTSYARDMRIKNERKKIVAQKSAKVDNVTDESQNH